MVFFEALEGGEEKVGLMEEFGSAIILILLVGRFLVVALHLP